MRRHGIWITALLLAMSSAYTTGASKIGHRTLDKVLTNGKSESGDATYDLPEGTILVRAAGHYFVLAACAPDSPRVYAAPGFTGYDIFSSLYALHPLQPKSSPDGSWEPAATLKNGELTFNDWSGHRITVRFVTRL